MSYILAINSGSSSLKVTLYKTNTLKQVEEFHLAKISSHETHLQKIADELNKKYPKAIQAVCHRIVHGADQYTVPTLLTTTVVKNLEKLNPLAPLHNPINLLCVKFAKKYFKCPHIAIFDTAFFKTLPSHAYLYGIPIKYYLDDKIRKYGFHGISHNYIYQETCKKLNQEKLSGIICHLGNGCSISAIRKGKAIDTSMGFTPLEGTIMGTRSGSIDPGIIFYLQRRYPKLNTEKLLLEKSGLKGLSQISNHMLSIHDAAKEGDPQAKQTIKVFTYSIAKYVGFYSTLLPDIDFITFTGGIGENASYIKNQVIKQLPGLIIDLSNILVIPTNENLQMARETKELLLSKD